MTTTTCADPAAPAEAEPVSIYDAIGGRPAVAAAVEVFFRRLLADPELAPYFPDGVGAKHRRYLATFLGEALGGPKRYRGPDIATAHRGLSISDDHFNRAAACLFATLEELGVPRYLSDRIVGMVAEIGRASCRERV